MLHGKEDFLFYPDCMDHAHIHKTPKPKLSKEQKDEYNGLIISGREEEKKGHLEEAIKIYQRAQGICSRDIVLKRIQSLEERLAPINTLLLDDEYDGEESDEEDESMFRENDLELPIEMYNALFPYQREGLMWMWDHYKNRRYGILGDDMGMGKSVQTACFLNSVFRTSGSRVLVLLVCPVSLMDNWTNELKKWCPGIAVRRFHGSEARSREAGNYIRNFGGVLLTSYGTVQSRTEKLRWPRAWNLVILDEGHIIKNPSSQTSKAISTIDSLSRFILTGTLVQNNLKELWTLFNYVSCGRLLDEYPYFKATIESKILAGSCKRASAYARLAGENSLKTLHEKIGPYYLRREKTRLLNSQMTVQKNDLIVWLKLAPEQVVAYREFGSSEKVRAALMEKKSALLELNICKKICDHPLLLEKRDGQPLPLPESALEATRGSIKMQFALQLIQGLCSEGHKTLVFSRSLDILSLFEVCFRSKGITYTRMDGSTDVSDRDSMVENFNTAPDISCMLLTTQVGGLGLNLVGADRVLIYDPSWNPAVDNQAVDRAYRLGQTRDVVIYRLVTCGTIEEKIYQKQVFKGGLSKSTNNNHKRATFRYFGRRELRDIFRLRDPTRSEVQEELSNLHKGQRNSYPALDEHLETIQYFNGVYGFVDHDLLYSRDDEEPIIPDEGDGVDALTDQLSGLAISSHVKLDSPPVGPPVSLNVSISDYEADMPSTEAITSTAVYNSPARVAPIPSPPKPIASSAPIESLSPVINLQSDFIPTSAPESIIPPARVCEKHKFAGEFKVQRCMCDLSEEEKYQFASLIESAKYA